MTNILSTKEIIHSVALGIPEGMKNAVSVSVDPGPEMLIRNEDVTSKKHKAKTHLKIFYMWNEYTLSKFDGQLKIEQSFLRI